MIILSQTLGEIVGSEQEIVVDIIVDTPLNLPAQNALSPYKIVSPSTVRCVSGERFMMRSNGSWVQQPADATISLDLSGYYTSVETDSAIAAALSSYYTGSQTDSAIAAAISAEYAKIGTAIPDNADLHSADYDIPGIYYKSSNATTCVNLPSNFAGAAFTLEVRNTTTVNGNRVRHILKPAAPVSGNPVPHIWEEYKTGTPATWRDWVDFSGTIVGV